MEIVYFCNSYNLKKLHMCVECINNNKKYYFEFAYATPILNIYKGNVLLLLLLLHKTHICSFLNLN